MSMCLHNETNIRAATRDDAAFIAECVYMAFLIDLNQYDIAKQHELLTAMKAVTEREDTLYSWRNAHVAMWHDERAGMTLSYDGARYVAMKEATLPLLRTIAYEMFGEGFDEMSDETTAGEYYVDTLAVMPSFRRNGIGRCLLQHCVTHADGLGLTCTLLVAPGNKRAKMLYESAGFRKSGQVRAFNEMFQVSQVIIY